MDKSSHLYISEPGEAVQKEPDMSCNHTDHGYPKQDLERDSFLCQHCQRHFSSSQGLERHMHVHTYGNNEARVYKSSTLGSTQQQEKTKPVDEDHSVVHIHTSSLICTNSSTFTIEDPTVQQHTTTDTNKQQHGWIVQENQLEITYEENAKLAQEEIPQSSQSEPSKLQTKHAEETVPTCGLQNEGAHAQQYILNVPGNISENIRFYIDGKMVSANTISNCEVAEVQSGTSALVGLNTLIVDPAQISQLLNTDAEIPGQQHVKRRTTTPPLLPQIKPELEVAASSSSSSLLSSLLENLFPQKSESAVKQKEGTVLLSPNQKQELLEKQEGPKPTLALVTDGQKPSSPVSLSVLPSGTGKFRRRTSSPTGLPQQNTTANEETSENDLEDFSTGNARLVESQDSPMVSEGNDMTLSTPVTEVKAVLSESWPPVIGGTSCNQKPLDLSNTVKRNEDVASGDAVLDLSLQRKNLSESESILNFVSQAVMKGHPNMCMVDEALVKVGEQKLHLGNATTPLLTDLTLVTGSDVMGPLEHVAEGLVYGLAIPPSSLAPSTTPLTPAALEPASPCTIAFASPVAHTILPTAPSVITVLAPQSISNPSNQPIQVLAPNLSHEPLIICTEDDLHSSDSHLSTPFAATNPANIVTFSQALDPPLNLPGHMFLSDQIAISPPVVESSPVTQVPFTPTLSDSLLNIASNAVLIECTIALEAPGSVVPAAVMLQENAEPQTKKQHVVSTPNSQTEDPTNLMPSISESVTLSTNAAAISDSSAVNEPTSEPDAVDGAELSIKEDEVPPTASPLHEKAAEKSSDTENDAQQTFTKNFICNVCDKLFHSMKQLGHHVADHADEWPYKCEFCVLLFVKPSDLLDHRSSLHGVGTTYVCSLCTKEFVYLCNLKQHQEEFHPGQQCSHTEEEKGKLRPQNYNSAKVSTDPLVPKSPEEPKKVVKKEQCEVEVAADELFTTIKIMASDGVKMKGPDVRLGINQHYPSFKPPPFPYHNRSPAGSLASATHFTTHNIPQTFSTAIRCTKCGKSFDNLPELHKHILACANASDKRRYTPRKNPIPLRHFAKSQNGVLSTTNPANGLNRVSQANGSKPSQESPVKLKILTKRKKKLVQRVMPQRNKSVPSSNKVSPTQVDEPREIFVCPHCSREFTMRRSRTKHMAVCPRKSQEIKKRKGGDISVTKENDEHLQIVKEKLQSSTQHNTRLQKSGSVKRHAILPVQTVFSSKRSKIIIKENTQAKQEAPTVTEVPIRTFNPSMRQYSRVHHGIKGVPINITIVKPRQSGPQEVESSPTPTREEPTGTIAIRTEQNVSA